MNRKTVTWQNINKDTKQNINQRQQEQRTKDEQQGSRQKPLCCLFFFNIRILITPLVSSKSSYLSCFGI